MKWHDIPHALKLVTGPLVEPLLYADLKTYPGLRLQDDTDEAHVSALIVAARQKVEEDTGRKLITQTWDLYADAFPSDYIGVPIEPLVSATIKTTTSAGVESTLAAANYQVDIASSPPRILLADTGNWPSDIRTHHGIVIRIVAGYGASGASVPGPLLQAMRECVRLWYVPGGGQMAIPTVKWMGYQALIDPYRSVGLA